MKLLGWMHRKLRQNNSTEPFKDLVIGNSCNCLSGQPSVDDEQNYHQKPNLNIKFTKQTQKTQNNLRKSFASLQSTREEEEEDEDEDDDVESQASMFDLFPGFLAIGTLGSSDQTISSTPTLFPTSVETITENEDEVVTENDLKLINDELEKVLTKDDLVVGSYDSSRRNSHVSTGRNSHVSIVTISGKPIENTEGYQYLTKLEGAKEFSNTESSICPLQGYLFGTAVEYSETAAVSVGKKEHHRTSLGELFQRSKLVGDENFVAKDYDKRSERDHAEKFSAMNLVKEKLKKRMFHTCSKNSASIDSASAETKLNKILHMFRKKVHPENSTIGQKCARNRKNENKKKIMNDGGYNKGYLVHPEEDSASYREHWIKTDADYLVLEL